ncbi:MAG: DUF58 domain-containing protein [Acidobacteria bacterium]|nr:MAG: DUF58 domain-containing protein [Acidobacteriota bacterium]REK10499.1 MAG: DUF58 domain-containing protein [Acidobacteriota bacterium]
MSARPAPAATSELFDADFLARLERLRLVSRRMLPGAFKGEHRSRKRGSGVEFADYRPYVEGDSLRFVDWPAYLRFDKLLVRTFEEEEDLPIYLLLDCSRSMEGEPDEEIELARTKFGMARRLCAAIAYIGLVNLDRVTLMLYRERIVEALPTLRGPTQIHRILRCLEHARTEGATRLETALRDFLAVPRRRGLVVVISDLFDDGAVEAMARLCLGHDVLALRLLTREEAAPELGLGGRRRLRLVDSETGREHVLHVDQRLLDAYARELELQDEAVAEVCRKRHWTFLRSDPGEEFDDVVQRIFRTGRLLR